MIPVSVGRRFALAAAVSFSFAAATTVTAQSGTRSYSRAVPSQPRAVAPVQPRAVAPMQPRVVAPMQSTVQSTPVAMRGYCPVCVTKMKKWVKGNPAIKAVHDGKVYYFPGEDQRQMFLADPAKYVPALGGNCAVCLTDMKQSMKGSVMFTALHKGRLFLFPNDEIKQKFMADPAKYENADLALGGNCAVCREEMNEAVPGTPEFATTYKGMRYLFPADKQRQMFVANPGKYAVQSPAGSGTKVMSGGSTTKGSGTK